MKILQIVKGLDIGGQFGGAERFGVELGFQLKNMGHEVEICAFFETGGHQEAEWKKRIEDAGLGLIILQPWRGGNQIGDFILGIHKLNKTLRVNPPTVVHSHFQLGSFAGISLKKHLNVPVCIRTAHLASEWETGIIGRIKFALARHFYPRYLDIQTGVSQEIVDRLSSDYKFSNRTLPPRLIYNAIILRNDDSSPIEPKNENSFFTLGSVGRLSEQKGYSDLISALALAGESIPNLRLILIGDGELRESLESKAMSLGIEDKVFFVGKVNNVSDYLRQMDLFISSSLWEGLPTVIMEAMLAGVPVVGTSIPGTTDLITAGVNGWLAPSGNPELLSQEIVKAVQDPVQQQKFKDAARKSVEEFSLERIAEKYELLYKEILSTKQH